MKAGILFLFSLFLFQAGFAQSKSNSISSIVKNDRNEMVSGATIRLLQLKDSVLISLVKTDETGKYHFVHISNGTYYITVKALGQRLFQSNPIELDGKNSLVELPAMILSADQRNNLAEVVIQSRKPLIQMEMDKTVVNVDAMISSTTSNTLEVLAKTPGVTVGANGEIGLSGRTGVLVLIDGRSTYMSGQDLAAYLKSIPGSQLDKIELIDNPSAKYDAAGNAIINIKLKKNRQGGFTGSLATGYSQGKYDRSNNSLSLNYNYKKINVFGNLGYSYEKTYADDDMTRNFFNAEGAPASTVTLQNRQQNKNNAANTNVGMDYAATAHTTFGMQFNYSESRNKGNFGYNSANYSGALDSTGNGTTKTTNNRTNYGGNINMLHQFGDSGKELSADLNYLNYNNTNEQSLQNLMNLPDGTLTGKNDFLYHLPSTIHVYTFKADYVHPLKNKAKLEAGVKSSWVNNDNLSDYYRVDGADQGIDNGQSNHFKYSENINAAYLNAQKSWNYFSLQLGLRAENTVSHGDQLGNATVAETSFKKNYTGFFPSLMASYKLDTLGKNTFSFAITRRLYRPGYLLLNDFLVYRDQYSYTSGNSLLGPEYQNRYEIKYQYKQLLRIGFSYNKFSNLIFQTTQVVDNIFITQPENVSGGHIWMLNTGMSLAPEKWWKLNTDLMLARLAIKGSIYGVNLNPQTSLARLNLLNQFTIGQSWSAELGGHFDSKDLNGQTFTGSMYIVNAGIQKKVFKNMGSIRLAADDIFHSWVYHNRSVDLPQANYLQTTRSDSQRFSLGFTYRFGKDTFASKSKHENDAQSEERSRM
ncbi:outer membrane beta-barrel family protein [Pedobacter sp. L105]|uniref:outer membrane beta-barrel family protein n=1 Tax=Pedobacter sp. L105 TaxID=1641871 RepID=UPI00131DB8D7|nr:outer membrane beta-barrel family protein [Pedobacter sp. L105]